MSGPTLEMTAARRVAGVLALALALVAASAGVARATLLVALPLPQLTAEAGAILHGVVTDVRSDWNPSRTHIFTFVTVRADRYLKGDLGSTVTLMEFGGTVGDLRQEIPGVPQFTPGQEVVLFLSVKPPLYPAVLSLSQGQFTVTRGADGRTMLTRNLYGASLVGRGDPLNQPMSLSAFETQVSQLVRPAAGPKALHPDGRTGGRP